LGTKAKAFMDKGALVPDELVIQLVMQKMQDPNVKEKGWILDGFPRTQSQAEALKLAGCNPDKIIFIDVPDHILEERVCGRRTDPRTGIIYHIKYKPAPLEIESRLLHRKDDTPEALKTRLNMYHTNNLAVLNFYKNDKPIDRIDGTRSPDSVYADIHNSAKISASL